MAPERADTYGGGYGGYGGGSASASAKLTPGYDEPSYGYGGYEGSGSKRGYSNYGSGALTPPSTQAPAAPPPPADGWNAFDDEGYMATVSKQAAKDIAVGMGEMNDEELEHAVNCFAHFDVGRTGLLKIPQFTELLRVVHKAEGERWVGSRRRRSSSRRTCRTTARWTSTNSEVPRRVHLGAVAGLLASEARGVKDGRACVFVRVENSHI